MLTSLEGPAPVRPVLTTTVAKEFVHRAALADVFLTGWSAAAPDTFDISAQWPRCHSFYLSEHGLYDPLLLCETIRQTFPLLLHAAYGVPFGYQLSWSRFNYLVMPGPMRIHRTPAEISLRVQCSDIVYRGSLPAALTMRFEISRGDEFLAVASTAFRCLAPAVYRRLRPGRSDREQIFVDAPSPAPPLPHDVCGRERPQDVVLAPTDQERCWELRSDTGHPVLFDHPVDHVPGMVLLEAARQVAHACGDGRASGWPSSMDVRFSRYVEFDSPCRLTAEPAPSPQNDMNRTVRVEAVQDGRSCFDATVTTAPVR